MARIFRPGQHIACLPAVAMPVLPVLFS